MRKKITLNTDQRPFSMIYHDSIDSEVLETIHQLVLFIALKRFLDENDQCFPSLKKLAKVGRMSQRKARITLRELEQKGLLNTKNRIKNDGSPSTVLQN